jgi:hypothetical protein
VLTINESGSIVSLVTTTNHGETNMNANQIIAETLAKMALSTLALEGEGDDRSLSEAIPLPLATELAGRLRGHGFEVSVARDNDDRNLAWVYVAEPSEADAMRDGE